MLYANGQGVPQNYVRAHMWYKIAASSASTDIRKFAVEARDNISSLMTSQQIAQALPRDPYCKDIARQQRLH